MKVVFLGSGPFALPALEVLWRHRDEFPLLRVISRPARPGKRGRRLLPTPVAARCDELGMPCETPESINAPDVVAGLVELEADLFVVADYGQILRRGVLDAPRIGIYNLHGSVLPKYRGAAPVQYALLDGAEETGVTLFRIEAGLDSGPVVGVARLPIEAGETAGELEERLSHLAAELLEEHLAAFADGSFSETPQDDAAATLAPKIDKGFGRIDWTRRARDLDFFVRALNPWPIAHSWLLRDGMEPERTALLRAIAVDSEGDETPGTITDVTKKHFDVRCGEGCLRVTEVQKPGKPAMAASAYLNGNALRVGDRFDSLREPVR